MKKVLGILMLAALAQVPDARAAGADRADARDTRIAFEVVDSVSSYANFTVFDDVNAHVKDGDVTLTGKVTMPYKRDEIRKRVEKVDGVRSVRNDIEILPVSRFDDELRMRIARAIYNNSNFWNYASMVNPPIHIIVERGRVTLTGVVISDVDRAMARAIASQFGAFSVTTKLRTDREVREAASVAQ